MREHSASHRPHFAATGKGSIVFQPRRILCPIDLSSHSAATLQVAGDIARQYRATLLVLHVADTLGPENLSFGEATTQLQPEAHIADLWRRLRAAAPLQPDIEMRHQLAEGDLATVVERVVREEHCDLVVLGTHGRTGLARRLMGSIAGDVLRRCPCPVLLHKYSDAETPA
jgi:nucleotide-binding universal stress UspA family protein